MWDVNLLYTAVTRGKKRVILIGEEKTLAFSVANFKQNTRITGLKEQILAIFGQKSELEEEVFVEPVKVLANVDNVDNSTPKKPSPFDILRANKPNPFKK